MSGKVCASKSFLINKKNVVFEDSLCVLAGFGEKCEVVQ